MFVEILLGVKLLVSIVIAYFVSTFIIKILGFSWNKPKLKIETLMISIVIVPTAYYLSQQLPPYILKIINLILPLFIGMMAAIVFSVWHLKNINNG